jgi:hypothetical protein
MRIIMVVKPVIKVWGILYKPQLTLTMLGHFDDRFYPYKNNDYHIENTPAHILPHETLPLKIQYHEKVDPWFIQLPL